MEGTVGLQGTVPPDGDDNNAAADDGVDDGVDDDIYIMTECLSVCL